LLQGGSSAAAIVPMSARGKRADLHPGQHALLAQDGFNLQQQEQLLQELLDGINSIFNSRLGRVHGDHVGSFSFKFCMNATFSVRDGHAYVGDEALPNRVVGQDVADAAYNTAHLYPGGVAAIALRMRVNKDTLSNKVNPNNTTHHLSLREAVAMQELSGDYSILHAMAEALGHAATRATPDQSGGDPVEALMRLQCDFADFVRAVTEALRGGGAVTGNQVRKAEHFAQETIATVGHALAALRRRVPRPPEGDA